MIKYEVLKTIPEMVPWGEMHEKLKNEELGPMSKVKECIISLNREIEASIVIHEKKNQKNNKIVEDYVPKKLLEHNYRFLGMNGGGNHQILCSW